jgi:hypothetical protein
MAFASGPGKYLTINEETTFGTAVASGGVYLDRVTSTVDLTKDTYQSNAILRTAQVKISRHGMRKVGGAINGELNPGAYSRVIQAHLRKDFANGATTTGTTISTLGASLVRSSGSWIASGTGNFKVGSVVSPSGFATGTTTAFNGKRYLVASVGTGTMTLLNLDGTTPSFGTNTSGDTVTVAEVGKVTYFPESGHTDKSVSIEHFYSDIGQSELYTGCKFGGMNVQLPTTGLATVQFDVMGQDLLRDTSQQLTSPSDPTSGNGLASVNGVLLIDGVASGIINSLNFKTDTQQATDGVVGSNITPFVWQGVLKGTGQIVAFFEDATFRDYFVDETEIGLVVLLTAGNTNTSDFMCFTLPRVKINGATKDDKQTGGLKLTGNIEFLDNTAGGDGTNSEATTIRVQDSLAA